MVGGGWWEVGWWVVASLLIEQPRRTFETAELHQLRPHPRTNSGAHRIIVLLTGVVGRGFGLVGVAGMGVGAEVGVGVAGW